MPRHRRKRQAAAVAGRDRQIGFQHLDAFFENGRIFGQRGRLPIGPIDPAGAGKREDQRFQHRLGRPHQEVVKPRIQTNQIQSPQGLIILRHSYTLPLTSRSGILGALQSTLPERQRNRRYDPEEMFPTIGR